MPLLYLACPIAMGVMMWIMMRGNHNPASDTSAKRIDILESELRAIRARDSQANPASDDPIPSTR